MNKQKNIIIGISSIFLLLAGFNFWPYGFFVFLRFVVCASGIYLAWLAYKTNQINWVWVYGIIAVLFNPFLPLHFGRSAWVVIDIIIAIFLIISSFLFRITNKKKTISTKDRMDFSEKLVFKYEEYFDVPEGRDFSGFDKNQYKFNPYFEDYFVYKIDNISDKKIRLSFCFSGGRDKESTFNGKPALFTLKARFFGYILCDDVISVEKEEANDKDVVFTIKRDFENEQKIIIIKNPEVGSFIIKCKKLYAEKLDCYLENNKGWFKEED